MTIGTGGTGFDIILSRIDIFSTSAAIGRFRSKATGDAFHDLDFDQIRITKNDNMNFAVPNESKRSISSEGPYTLSILDESKWIIKLSEEKGRFWKCSQSRSSLLIDQTFALFMRELNHSITEFQIFHFSKTNRNYYLEYHQT